MNNDVHRSECATHRPRRLRCALFVIAFCSIGLSVVEDRAAEAPKKKTDSSLSKLFKHQPPVVTGRVGWWDRHAELKIEGFTVEVVKKRNPVTGSPTRLKIHITGGMTRNDGYSPYIKEVFVSERLAHEQSPDKYVDVLIVPVVDGQSRHGKNGEIVPFDIAVDYELYGYQWDDNRYLFRCGDKTVDLTVVIGKGK
jgi:hypothetical protein